MQCNAYPYFMSCASSPCLSCCCYQPHTGQDVEFIENQAAEMGGAVCCFSCGHTVLSGVSILRNTAAFGGGLYLKGGMGSVTVLSQCTVRGNSAAFGPFEGPCSAPGLSGEDGENQSSKRTTSGPVGSAEVGSGGGVNILDGTTLFFATKFEGGLAFAKLCSFISV